MHCILKPLALGAKFGRWTVAGPYVGGHEAYWPCVCECGTSRLVSGKLLRRGESRSCGCLQRELAAARIRSVVPRSPVDRFWSQVNKDGPVVRAELGSCWEWIGSKTTGGYGRIGMDKRYYGAHRASWFFATGAWPAMWVLHKCDNRTCVRPEHLYEGDHHDNTRDRVSRGRGARGAACWNRYARGRQTQSMESK